MSRRSYTTHTWTEVCAFWGMVIAAVAYIFSGLFNFLVNYWIALVVYVLGVGFGMLSVFRT